MKRTLTFVSSIMLAIGFSMAQSIGELFEGNDLLTSVFVNPLGINNLPATTDCQDMEEKIKDTGVEYRSMHLGPFGETFIIKPSEMKIGATPIAGIGINVNNGAIMVIYQSEVSDNYRDMSDVLDKALSHYSIDIERREEGGKTFTVYMLSDSYGIAAGTDEINRTAICCLLDMKNLQGFLGLSLWLGNRPAK